MKAYSYIRWSSEIQTQGDSLNRQLEATRKICSERNWELDETLKPDKGLSGYTGSNVEKGSLGQFLQRRIVFDLNADKIPATRSENGWSPVHVRRILTSRSVLGEYQPMKHISRNEKRPACDPIPHFYPAIIDKATFYKAQERLLQNKRTGGPRKEATNIFTGLLKCAHCGASMVITYSGNKKKGYKQNLVCSNAFRGNGCESKTIRYKNVERGILTALWVKVLPAMSTQDNRAEKLIELQGELKDTKAKVEKLADILFENPSAAGAKSLAALEAKQGELTKQVETISCRIQDNPLPGWQQVPETVDNRLRLQAILSDEIKSITVDASKQRATLEMKETHSKFEMVWHPKLANAAKKDPSSEGFDLNEEHQPYLDKVLIWKSDARLEPKIVTDGEGNVCPGFIFAKAGVAAYVAFVRVTFEDEQEEGPGPLPARLLEIARAMRADPRVLRVHFKSKGQGTAVSYFGHDELEAELKAGDYWRRTLIGRRAARDYLRLAGGSLSKLEISVRSQEPGDWPKTEYPDTPEERLLREIFGEGNAEDRKDYPGEVSLSVRADGLPPGSARRCVCIKALLDSAHRNDEHFIFTCSCGQPECAEFREGSRRCMKTG